MKAKKVLLFALLFAFLFVGSAALPDAAIAQDDTDDNPWVFQDWCLDHVGCGRYGLKNKTDGWLQVYLTSNWTGEKGFFTVPPKGTNFITLRPGMYHATFVYWCDGKMGTWEWWNIALNQFWTDVFNCPAGYWYSIRR